MKKGKMYALLLGCFGILFGTVFYIKSLSNKSYKDDYNYIDKPILNDLKPVIKDTKTITRPFLDENVKIKVNYYDYKSTEDEQKSALIYFENTYLQNSGVVYGMDNDFDVVSILDGVVTEVKEDKTLNTIVTIKHENNVISVYQGLKDVTVKKDEKISAGTVIGKSSESNMLKNYKSTILFELIVNGTNVNPENYYNKTIDELS
ncbi:MAG: M23 family metallopeptidase [Bacillales bacterium]|nr:M23 family metallopeptidase [Bacillales bacterium]